MHHTKIVKSQYLKCIKAYEILLPESVLSSHSLISQRKKEEKKRTLLLSRCLAMFWMTAMRDWKEYCQSCWKARLLHMQQWKGRTNSSVELCETSVKHPGAIKWWNESTEVVSPSAFTLPLDSQLFSKCQSLLRKMTMIFKNPPGLSSPAAGCGTGGRCKYDCGHNGICTTKG